MSCRQLLKRTQYSIVSRLLTKYYSIWWLLHSKHTKRLTLQNLCQSDTVVKTLWHARAMLHAYKEEEDTCMHARAMLHESAPAVLYACPVRAASSAASV